MNVVMIRIYEDDIISAALEISSEISKEDIEILRHFIIFKSIGDENPRWILPNLFRLKRDIRDNMGELSFLDRIVCIKYGLLHS